MEGKKLHDKLKEITQLLNEINDKMYSLVEFNERLQPIHINESNKEIVDLTHEMYDKTKLFRLRDLEEMDDFNDQHSRSMLKDLRKAIKYLNEVNWKIL